MAYHYMIFHHDNVSIPNQNMKHITDSDQCTFWTKYRAKERDIRTSCSSADL